MSNIRLESYYVSQNHWQADLKYCGYEQCSSTFIMYPHTRSEYLIHYVTQGEGTFVCEGITYSLHQNDLFLIQPSQLVSYYTAPHNPLHFAWFAFTAESADQLIQQLGFSPKRAVRKLNFQDSIEDDIRLLVEESKPKNYCNDFKVKSLLYTILFKIASSNNHSANYAKKDTDITYEHIKQAKEYIKYNYMRPITVMDVVTHVNLERSYFSKIFRKYTGITAQNYLLKIRIEHSKLLLERTDYSIKKICYYVGLKDEYYFSRAFKNLEGVSPTTYRNNLSILTDQLQEESL